MRRVLAEWYRGFVQARQERAAREVLMYLDAHTLRDIGVESWNGELAERVHARRRREVLTLAAARIGAY